ncbi:hypothetical protein MKX01_014022 [Papaver californicum]|nr:hypothetical protein MKX01_014022 [Papaver californicum]
MKIKMEKLYLLISICSVLSIHTTNAQMSGFVSLNCGGKENFTDSIGLEWKSDNRFSFGERATISVPNETRRQYMSVRYFPENARKYCYTLDVNPRTRYLIRTTFLYGNFDNSNVYPKFDVSIGATHWSTIVISDVNTIEVRELIVLASSPMISVCLSNATTGQPFISTIELRPFNGSIYYTEHETEFFLAVSARINFGALNQDPIRYPDDPFDRLWVSDSLQKANYLVDVARGTKKVSTNMPIDVYRDERPPEKVMQTAVVGTNGSLTYRLNLDGFPGFGWAVSYFAEIEDLSPNDTRKFHFIVPGIPYISKPTVDIQENAKGKYTLYEPGFTNMSFPFVFNFEFARASGSTRGPLLNAIEINRYLKINPGSIDEAVMASLVSRHSLADWAGEGGDPCLPVPWSWLRCNSDPQPKIISITLSKKYLTGSIPLELTKLEGLVELWLDGNSFTGPIPDFTACKDLKIIHLENNLLTGEMPSSLTNLQKLKELYLQDNMLSGAIPSGLLLNQKLVFNYSGNPDLDKEGSKVHRLSIIVGVSVGAAVMLLAAVIFFLLYRERKRQIQRDDVSSRTPSRRLVSSLSDTSVEAAYCFAYADLETATKRFEKQVGSGGFGMVYFGKMKDGREVAVKVLTSNSYQGKKEFTNEVTLLSRIHHRNLVQFLGYCQEEGKSILVYEFMHNGTLKEHLYGPLTREKSVSWIKRLEIAEDAAKGIEYLHTGCVPTIIHRDLKSSNILLDKNMKAKISDFGLSKLAIDGSTHVSSIVRGTIGYLDPEYYISQQLTDKSDVYSFGVILLELISGQEAISNKNFGANCHNIIQWARTQIESGNIQGIIDPSLQNEYNIQSIWKIAEKALMCVQSHGSMRPSISEVLKEIQDALLIEKGANLANGGGNSDDMSKISSNSSYNLGPMELGTADQYHSFEDSIFQPVAR